MALLRFRWIAGLAWLALAVPDPARADEGPWHPPLDAPPRVVRGFDPPEAPWASGHRGVDLAAHPGQPVYAAGPGRVGYAGMLAGREVVAIVHGMLRTTYLPVHPSVRVGQRVRPGERIGTLAAAPRHCAVGPCLHWGLRRGGQYLDPLTLLGYGPLRLLPVWGVPAIRAAAAPGGPGTPAAPPGTVTPPPRGGGAGAVPASAPACSPSASGGHRDVPGGHRDADPPPRFSLVGSALAGTGGASVAVAVLALLFRFRPRGTAKPPLGRRRGDDTDVTAATARHPAAGKATRHPGAGPAAPPPSPTRLPARPAYGTAEAHHATSPDEARPPRFPRAVPPPRTRACRLLGRLRSAFRSAVGPAVMRRRASRCGDALPSGVIDLAYERMLRRGSGDHPA